jgi:hypothetical protein
MGANFRWTRTQNRTADTGIFRASNLLIIVDQVAFGTVRNILLIQ